MESLVPYRLAVHLLDFDVGLRDTSLETIREYGAWFRKVLPERVAELTAEIRRTANLATWEPDRSPESLRLLEIWFASQVEMRPLGTRWEIVTKGSRRYVDYGQPVLVGAGKVPLNPLRVITMTAYAVADGRTAELASLYETWAGKLRASTPNSAH